MMVNLTFVLVRILFISCCFLTIHCSKPNCTSVPDFQNCPGNVKDFCPKNIICACKDEEPFCQCPNFRGRLGNYWYMGAKCEQLWNTLDLILVATLPGLGFALIVGLTIQIIHCYRNNLKRNKNNHRQQSFSGTPSQHHSTYAFNTAVIPQPYQSQVQNPCISSPQTIFPKIAVSLSSGFSGKNDNFMIYPQKEDNLYISPSYNGDGSLGIALPEADYENKNFSNMHMKPLSSYSISSMPRSSNIQRERRQFENTSFENQEIPLRIGRAHIKSNY